LSSIFHFFIKLKILQLIKKILLLQILNLSLQKDARINIRLATKDLMGIQKSRYKVKPFF